MSEAKEELKRTIKEIDDSHHKWRGLRRFNRNCDAALTITTILLTLFTTIVGVEGISFGNNDNIHKALIGISGGLVVAVQSIGNAFPVKQRAGGYQLLQGQAYTLKSRLGYLQQDDEINAKLPQIREEYYKLIAEADKLES